MPPLLLYAFMQQEPKVVLLIEDCQAGGDAQRRRALYWIASSIWFLRSLCRKMPLLPV